MKALLHLLLLVPVIASAQAQMTNSTATPMGRASMAERNGQYADAAAQYGAILKTQPASLSALVGMEHVLPKLDRRGEMGGLITLAVAADSQSTGILGVAVRYFAATAQPDSARKYVERWFARVPGDGDPFREWSDAALVARDLPQARLALDVGRQKMGPNAFGIERAELLQRAGDIAGAVLEWIPVVRETPPFREGAVGMLERMTMAQRPAAREAFLKDGTKEARQMLGLLLVRWGQPADGAAMVRGALPIDTAATTILLRQLVEALQTHADRASLATTAATLEAVAARELPASSVHTLMDAARAYADAGDDRNARRVLAQVSSNPAAPGGMATVASSTLLGVLIAEGKGADAERVLAELGGRIGIDEHDRLARRIAMVWVHNGDFARADAMIVNDSSSAGFDLRGRLRAYRGDFAGANDLLKAAGPFDEEREQVLERVALLSLIQAVGVDSSTPLGTALLTLEKGDSVGAFKRLVDVANSLKGQGAAETRLLAGRVALGRADTTAALEQFTLANVKEFPATAAAARFDMVHVAVAQGKIADAVQKIEALIIDYPESALVPEARRLRDTVRGAVPAAKP